MPQRNYLAPPICLAHARPAAAPQATVGTLVDGISAVLGAMAAQPALLRLFPGLAASPADAALAQWAACGALGGSPVRSLGSDAVNAALPWPPEFCGWAKSVMGASDADAALPLPAARTFLATLQSSACTLPAARARTPRRC